MDFNNSCTEEQEKDEQEKFDEFLENFFDREKKFVTIAISIAYWIILILFLVHKLPFEHLLFDGMLISSIFFFYAMSASEKFIDGLNLRKSARDKEFISSSLGMALCFLSFFFLPIVLSKILVKFITNEPGDVF